MFLTSDPHNPRPLIELFERHAPRLVLYARQWVHRRDEAEDVVQDVFARMVERPDRRNLELPWVYRCVRNAAISASRSARARGARENAVGAEQGLCFEARPGDLIDAADAAAALATLPAAQREIVTLRLWSDLGWQQIADVTGLPLSTAHAHYKLALAALRATLESRTTRTRTTPDARRTPTA
jgi:RNA polymerase sigma-70 factor (ECF subfamily)